MGSNSQTIVVSGAVVNLAAAGAKSTLDIGGAGRWWAASDCGGWLRFIHRAGFPLQFVLKIGR